MPMLEFIALGLLAPLSIDALGCRDHIYERDGHAILLPRQGSPYPTGPGYDVVPLDHIVPLPAGYSQNTIPLPKTFPAGSQPPIPNAPPIPQFNPGSTPWPHDWTLPPPTGSPQVKEWLKELDGHIIPSIALNKPVQGGNGVACADNPAAVSKAGADGSCWWSCSACLRDTDISTCNDKMTWGQTYDDGPGLYTPKLLTYLDSRDIKATFFLIGGNVISHPDTVVYQHMTGHEIGVHTWSHPALTTLTNEQIVAELGWAREAIKQVTGVTPVLFRPPYGDIDDRVRAIANAMNLIPVMWTTSTGNGGVVEWDSSDWRVHGGGTGAVENQNNLYNILNTAPSLDTGIIVLQHDIYVETVDIAIGATIPHALSTNPPFNHKSVQVCQNKGGIGNAYVETSNTRPPVLPSSSPKQGSNSASPSTAGLTTSIATGPSSSSRIAIHSSSITSSTPGQSQAGAAGRVYTRATLILGFLGIAVGRLHV